MKSLSQFVKEENETLKIQDNSYKNISVDDLKKYKDITNKFLDEDGKYVVDWLITYPDYYEALNVDGHSSCPLADFYNNGSPSNKELKPLFVAIKNTVKNNRILQIPVFQTKEQFDAIISKKTAPDEIILDLTTERGRNEVAKKYDALVWKIAKQFEGKSEFSIDDLYGYGMLGLVDAMNTYGKKTTKSKASDEDVKGYTFMSWASYRIRIYIIENIKDNGHLVRIPRSHQDKERKEKGHNTKSNSVSTDTPIGTDKSGNTKTLLDKIGDYERAEKSIDREEIEAKWKEIKKYLEEHYPHKEELEAFYDYNGLFKHDKLSGKQIIDKYKDTTRLKGISNVTNRIGATNTTSKIMDFIISDKKLMSLFNEINDMISECQHDDDAEDRDNNVVYLNDSLVEDDE